MATDMKMVAIGVTLVIVGGSFVGVMAQLAGMNNPVGDFWFSVFGDGGELPTDQQYAKVALDTQKKGAEATDPATTAYVWYDWDGDGQVDRGAYPDEGEIETVGAVSGLCTTTAKYPIGQTIWFQLHASGYQVMEISRVVPTPGAGWNGETALTVPAAQMILLDTSISVSVTATGTGGSVAMVTSSGDYNYTTYGTSPSIDVLITCATADAGIGQSSYNHWVTGKSYHGTFLAIKMVLTEKANVVFSDYDYIGDDGTSQWVVWDITERIFNDADLDDDGDYTLEFSLTIVGAFDWDEINIYDNVLETNFGQFAFGTADGQETDLDFIA